jgi:hypothetical protein
MRETVVDNWQLLVVSSVVSFVVCYFNYDAYEMGIFKYYECFRALIAAGFDSSAHTCDSNTFPMWGYGWLLLLSESKPVLLFIHCSRSIGSVLFLLTTVRTAFSLTDFQYNVLKWLVVLSLPWYALNSVLWPHSIAVSLLLISLALLIRAHCSATPEFRLWLLSGLSFGIMLNFRSGLHFFADRSDVDPFAVRPRFDPCENSKNSCLVRADVPDNGSMGHLHE